MQLTIINTQQGHSRIHAAGCADVAKDVRKYRDPYPETVEMSSCEELAVHLWGDVEGNEVEEGTPEHTARCVSSMDSVDVILPCAAELYAKPEVVEVPSVSAPTSAAAVSALLGRFGWKPLTAQRARQWGGLHVSRGVLPGEAYVYVHTGDERETDAFLSAFYVHQRLCLEGYRVELDGDEEFATVRVLGRR